MTFRNRARLGFSIVAIAAAASAGAQAQQSGGTATYWMTGETASGMAAMAGGDPAAIMQAVNGRPGAAAFRRRLMLQLGSDRRAPQPAAEHLPPQGLGAGPSLPLVSPASAPPAAGNMGLPAGMERPRGRILVYWGCGERAGAGQPAVIDFASLTGGQVPAAFANASIRMASPPAAGRNAGYGEWPNARSQAQVPATGSLVGDHVVRGNYNPEMRFSLAQGQDFLAPVVLGSNTPAASGAIPLSWQPVGGARAWMVTSIGAGANGDMVMWSSSEVQVMPMMHDLIPQEEVARLVQRRVLLNGGATSCTIPAEVARAGQGAMLAVQALGPEVNLSQQRPAGARGGWRPEWTVKLRTKSTYMGLLGVDMSGMMGAQAGERAQPQNGNRPSQRPRDVLRRGIGRALGL